MQSPAFALNIDRKGTLEEVFQNFTGIAGCAGQSVACLRAASADTFRSANTVLIEQIPSGTVVAGASADENLIRQTPALEFASGNFNKNIDSLILSHVRDEALIFIPSSIQTDADFNDFVQNEFPTYAQTSGVTAAIEARYAPVQSDTVHNYTTEFDRMEALLGDSFFYCNVHYITNAYKGKNYNLQYSVTPGVHGTDLLPPFYNLNLDIIAFGNNASVPLIPGFDSFAQAYQSYLVSHTRPGDPNTYKKTVNIPPAITWPKPVSSGYGITGVLNAGDLGFSVINDVSDTRESVCSFWKKVAAAVTNLGG